MSLGPIDFENGKNECRKGQTILETAEMGHYDLGQILKRRIGKHEGARDVPSRAPSCSFLYFKKSI